MATSPARPVCRSFTVGMHTEGYWTHVKVYPSDDSLPQIERRVKITTIRKWAALAWALDFAGVPLRCDSNPDPAFVSAVREAVRPVVRRFYPAEYEAHSA